MNIPKTVIKLFSAKLLAQGIGFVGLIFFARELGAEQMGIFFLFQAVLSLLALPADLGVREGIEKRISEGEDPEKILTTGLSLKLAFTFVLSIGLLAVRDIINDYIGGEVAFLLVIALFVNALAEVTIRTLRGELRVGETATLSFFRQFVWVGVGSLFVGLGFGYIGLIYSLILGLGVIFVWGTHKISTSFGLFSREQASSIWIYSKYSFVGAVGGSFYSWMDVAIIGIFFSQTYVGAYEMAWRVGVFVTLLSSTIAMTIFPQVSEWDANENRERIEALLPKAIVPSLFLVVPAFFGSLLLSHEILDLLFGQEYVVASVVLVMFMAINIVQAITMIVSRMLRALDQPRLVAKARLISMTVNLLLNIFLIWQLGIVGAALATGTALTIYTALVSIYLSDYISLRFPFHEIGWCVVASIGMTAVVATIQSLVEINTVYRLFGVVSIGAIIYTLIVFSYGPLRFKIMNNTRQVLT